MPLPEEGADEAVFDPQTQIDDEGWDEDIGDPTEAVAAPEPSSGQQQADEAQREAQHEANQPKAFDPKFREPFEGLLYLGALSHTFTWLGHEFTIRTLTVGEMMAVGQIHKEFVGSLGDTKAYQSAMVAACTERVDGMPLPIPPDLVSPPGSDDVIVLRDRFRYITRNWFPPTIDKIYEEFILLESQMADIVRSLGNP